MKLERIQTIQRLAISVEEAWDFLTGPQNLGLITPPWLDFRLTLTPPEYLHPGTIYGAQVRPFPGISLHIVTEITHIRAPSLYITQQRVGPFTLWHHEHHLREHKDGVEIEDIVHYGLPFGPLGTLFHDLVIRKKLHDIFTYRAHALDKRFGSPKRQPKPQQPAAQSRPRQTPQLRAEGPPLQQRKKPAPQQPTTSKPDTTNQPPQKTITLEDIFGGTPDD